MVPRGRARYTERTQRRSWTALTMRTPRSLIETSYAVSTALWHENPKVTLPQGKEEPVSGRWRRIAFASRPCRLSRLFRRHSFDNS